MSANYFDYPPTVEVLQKLVQPAILLENIDALCKSVRMWHALRQLYAPNPSLQENNLTPAQWRNFLFKDAAESHKRDSQPNHDDPECLCAKTIPEILFPSSDREEQWQQWKESFIAMYQHIRNVAIIHSFVAQLDTVRPFHLTGKALENDFEKLHQQQFINWGVRNKKRTISKVKGIPQIEIGTVSETTTTSSANSYDDWMFAFLSDDYGMIAENIAKPINNIQRFYLHSDYQTPSQASIQRIIGIVTQLKAVWKENRAIPVKLIYHSASLSKLGKPFDPNCVIYPVCIYYYQKAFYLCSFGQTPREKQIGGWYNYRLDRIKSLEAIATLPDSLPQYLQKFERAIKTDNYISFIQTQIDIIQDKLQTAYGFDFYRDDAEMVLCFPEDFDRFYNVNTYRHETFKQRTVKEVKRKVTTAALTSPQTNFLIDKIDRYNRERYAFYTLQYRVGDYAVTRRLRDWGYHVEVLLPWQLRQEVKTSIETNWHRYRDDIS